MYIAVYEVIMAKKESKKPEKSKEKPVKETKDKKGKKNETQAPGTPPATSTPASGIPPTGTPSVGATAAAPGVPPTGAAAIPLSQMPPEQMTAQQLEQAIKESNDPESRLKKLHSPISVKSCLLNLLILIIMTLAFVIIWCAIAVDKFNFVTVVKDMSYQFGITQGFQWLWAQISGWFS